MFVYFENLLYIVVVICGCRCLFLGVDVEEDVWRLRRTRRRDRFLMHVRISCVLPNSIMYYVGE